MVNISTIKNLDIRAIWNGSQDGVVQVNISITIDGQPDSRVVLLDITNEPTSNASVQSIRKVPSMATALVPNHVRQHSTELSGDTLIPSDAREYLNTIRMQELGVYDNDERQVEVMTDTNTWPIQYMQEHSSEQFGDAFDIRNAEAPLYLPLHTPCVGNYMARGDLTTPKRPHRLYPLRPFYSPQMPNDSQSRAPPPRNYTDSEPSGGKSRSTSCGTVEIHPPSSPTSSSDVSFRETVSTPDNSRSISPRDFSTPKNSRSEIRGKPIAIKPPWRSPNHQDFALKKKSVHTPSQPARLSPMEQSTSLKSSTSVGSDTQHSSTYELQSKSLNSPTGSLHSLESGTSGKMSKLKQQRYTVGRASGRKIKPRAKDEILNCKYYGSVPLFARSCLSFPSSSLGHGTEESNDMLRCIEDPSFEDPKCAESTSALEKVIPGCPSYIYSTSVYHSTRLPSPNIFPRVWLREESRTLTSLRNLIPRTIVATEPSWTNDDGKLYLVFGGDLLAGIYQVELEANLSLSKPDRSGWQSLKLSGLPSNEGKETTGGFELIVAPKLDTLELPELQFDTRHLLDARTLGSKELIARFRLLDPPLLYLRSKERIREIDNWNTAVTLYTVPTWSTNEGTQMKHHASLTFDVPYRDLFAEKVKFSIIVKYGPIKGHVYTLETDECSVSLANDDGMVSCSGPHASEAEITIIRSVQNLQNPLDLYFALDYPDKEYLTISLPTFRPKTGNVLSECMMLLKASPPLFLDLLARGHFSTWKMTEDYKGEDTWMSLHRIDISPLFPHGLKDDAMVRLRKLCPVHYVALEASDNPLLSEHPSNVIKELDIRLEKVFGEELECRMSLEIQVGSSCRLLTVDDHDWTPSFFVIDGRLATERSGEWRENEDGYKTLFKSSTTTAGQVIRLEMHWKELVISDEFKGESVDKAKIEYKIPRILGKVILGGTLFCRIDEGTLILSDGNKEMSYQFLDLYSLDTTRLPEMQPGYNMTLSFVREVRPRALPEPVSDVAIHSDKIRFLSGYPLSKRRVRFEDEDSDSSSESTQVTMSFKDAVEDAESDASSAFDENPPPISVPQIRDLALARSQRAQRWIDRVKNWSWLTFSYLSRISGYLLLFYMVVLITGIASETSTGQRGRVDYFDPNNIISDLLPSPIASLQRYRQPSQNGEVHNSNSTRGSKQQTEDPSTNNWDQIPGEGTTSTERPQSAPTSTKIAYVDWIDRALGWKGVGE